jgi:hypothetical protein
MSPGTLGLITGYVCFSRRVKNVFEEAAKGGAFRGVPEAEDASSKGMIVDSA